MEKKHPPVAQVGRQSRPLPAKRSTSEAIYQRSDLPAKRSKRIPQDILGNIAILKFSRKTLKIIKILKARKFLKQHKTITTVVEKTEKISGKLRTSKTKHLAGIKTKQATYKENNCTFKFNIDESYFSPRLSNERKIIADEVAKLKPKKILIMFAGIAPYPIIIAKRLLQSTSSRLPPSFSIYANELNKQANKEAKKNIILNKLQNYITLIPGNANRLPSKLKVSTKSIRTQSEAHTKRSAHKAKRTDKFDIILMPRPNLSDTFLKTALKLSKKGTTIFYHGFGTKQKVLDEIKKHTTNKITIRKAGDIGPHAFRWQAKFKVE